MAETLATWHDTDLKARGHPTEGYVRLYSQWGKGGYGMIITGQTDVDNKLCNMGCPTIGLEDELTEPKFDEFKRVASAATAEGSLILAQISHVGRQLDTRVSSDTISASEQDLDDKLGMTFAKTHEATKADIQRVIESFAHAAWFLDKAGFSGVQLHGAHGFLISSFLSRSTNHRIDEYGGSLENRMRLIIEIAAAIRNRVSPKFILGIKINSVEFEANGFTADEAKVLCQTLEQHHFDFVELTGGTCEDLGLVHTKTSTLKREAFFLEFAESIVPVLKNTKCYITGGIRTAPAMVEILQVVDGIGLGRPAAQEPNFPSSILSGKIGSAAKPISAIEHNQHVSLACAGGQILQLSKDVEPVDISDPAVANGVYKQLIAWTTAPVHERPYLGWPRLPTTTTQRSTAALE
ncbi:NADH:flavin oxidoreductase/NADH oxidase [Seiridium cupressi]